MLRIIPDYVALAKRNRPRSHWIPWTPAPSRAARATSPASSAARGSTPPVLLEQHELLTADAIKAVVARRIHVTSRVTRIAPAADTNVRVFSVEAPLPNPAGTLRPGTVVSVRVPTEAPAAQTLGGSRPDAAPDVMLDAQEARFVTRSVHSAAQTAH
jgi:multidrug efflux pump subunit AcrA (membrane-fusion protein)